MKTKALDKSRTLPTHWKCGQCGKNAKCEVPERAVAVDIKFWMATLVIPRIVHSHGLISPKCDPVAMSDGKKVLTIALAFPMPDDDHPIGQASEEAKEKARAAGFPSEPGKPL